METAGIIAEYNPFHNGHAWQIQQIRETLGKDCAIIVALSGNFCQRGEPALLNAWKRAEIALKLGCDLVLELPTAFSTASAERFAEGGVHLLAATGVVNHLVFGSEHGILDDLQSCAEQLSDENTVYRGMLHKALGNGLSIRPPDRKRYVNRAYHSSPSSSMNRTTFWRSNICVLFKRFPPTDESRSRSRSGDRALHYAIHRCRISGNGKRKDKHDRRRSQRQRAICLGVGDSQGLLSGTLRSA